MCAAVDFGAANRGEADLLLDLDRDMDGIFFISVPTFIPPTAQ
jgi:hypothetical protein